MLTACSACAGDYEDPDRTAWDAECGDARDGGRPELEGGEFPDEK